MADDNSKLVDMDNLDDFEDAFFEREPKVEVVKVNVDHHGNAEEIDEDDEIDETESNQLAPDEDEDADPDEEDEDSGEDEDETEEEQEEVPPPKKNRKSAKERIEELVAKTREQERRETELLRRMSELEASVKPKVENQEPTLREQLPPEAPQPDAVNEHGEPIYPLGEFDPKFIAAITRFSITQEMKAERERAAKEEQAKRVAQEKDELRTKWTEKVTEYAKDEPEYFDNVRSIDLAFASIDPQLGEYLATTIMQCDNGPAIMNYLSQNIGEAQKIVASGPFAATLSIGKLDALMAKKEAPRNNPTRKVSNAPNPPEARTRGTHGRFSVAPDTDDLDAFEKEYFKR